MIHARAVKIREPGGPEVLTMGELDVRDPGPGEVRVRVRAAGLNRADVMQRRGFYPAPSGVPADVPGLEYAGEIESLGDDVRDVAVGDRVMGIVAGGAMATSLVTHHRELIPMPAGMSFDDAAAIPEVFITAYDALFVQAGVGLGTTVLVHAVGSGVGTAATQLLRAAGARSLGTARTASKLEACKAYGLDVGILVRDGHFTDEVRKHTDGRGVDVILDAVGGQYLGENVESLAPQGMMVMLGLMGGAMGELPLGQVLARRLTVRGSVMRARPLEEKIATAQGFRRAVMPLFAAGALRPVVDAVLPMGDVAEAHARMERNETLGKIVLRWDD